MLSTRDKRQTLLVSLFVFASLCFLLRESYRGYTPQKNSSNKQLQKHFVFELNTWKGNVTCDEAQAYEDITKEHIFC